MLMIIIIYIYTNTITVIIMMLTITILCGASSLAAPCFHRVWMPVLGVWLLPLWPQRCSKMEPMELSKAAGGSCSSLPVTFWRCPNASNDQTPELKVG